MYSSKNFHKVNTAQTRKGTGQHTQEPPCVPFRSITPLPDFYHHRFFTVSELYLDENSGVWLLSLNMFLWDSSTFLYVVVPHLLFLIFDFLIFDCYKYSKINLELMDIWVVFNFWLLPTFLKTFLKTCMYFFLLHITLKQNFEVIVYMYIKLQYINSASFPKLLYNMQLIMYEC